MAVVLLREERMKGEFAGVVKMVMVMLRLRRSWARWRKEMVWPFDMKGRSTAWVGDVGQAVVVLEISMEVGVISRESMLSLLLLLFFFFFFFFFSLSLSLSLFLSPSPS